MVVGKHGTKVSVNGLIRKLAMHPVRQAYNLQGLNRSSKPDQAGSSEASTSQTEPSGKKKLTTKRKFPDTFVELVKKVLAGVELWSDGLNEKSALTHFLQMWVKAGLTRNEEAIIRSRKVKL